MFLQFQLLASLIGGKTHCLSPFHLSQDRIEQPQNTDKRSRYIYPLCNTHDFFLLSLFFTGWQYTATRVLHFMSCSIEWYECSFFLKAWRKKYNKCCNTKNKIHKLKNLKDTNWKRRDEVKSCSVGWIGPKQSLRTRRCLSTFFAGATLT